MVNWMDIKDLIVAITNGQVRITDHADEEAVHDQLAFDEISSRSCTVD